MNEGQLTTSVPEPRLAVCQIHRSLYRRRADRLSFGLELGDAASNNGAVAGNISDNATLIFADPAAQTYSGVISGSGVLTKLGAGRLTLTGSNTYSGLTTINAGNLAVNGSLSAGGLVNVNAAATLSGTGSVGGVTVAAAGTLAPGYTSGGTLSVASLNLNAGSDLAYAWAAPTAGWRSAAA